MSELQRVCHALSASVQPLPGLAAELQQRAARLRSLAGEVQQAASRVPNGPDVRRIVHSLHAAADASVAAAQSLAKATHESRTFVDRVVAGAATNREADVEGPQPTEGFPESSSLSVGQTEFIGAEFRTSVGSAFFYPTDERFRMAAHDVPSYPGEYVLDVHGTASTVLVEDSEENILHLTPQEFAEVVRRTGWRGEPIRLFSCYTGEDPAGFAKQLATCLGVPVTAPTKPVSTAQDAAGNVLPPRIGEDVTTFDPATGRTVTKFVYGTWKVFYP